MPLWRDKKKNNSSNAGVEPTVSQPAVCHHHGRNQETLYGGVFRRARATDNATASWWNNPAAEPFVKPGMADGVLNRTMDWSVLRDAYQSFCCMNSDSSSSTTTGGGGAEAVFWTIELTANQGSA